MKTAKDSFKVSRLSNSYYRINLNASVPVFKVLHKLQQMPDVLTQKIGSNEQYFFAKPFGLARLDISNNSISIKVKTGSSLEFIDMLIKLIDEFSKLFIFTIDISSSIPFYEGCKNVTSKQLLRALQNEYNSYIVFVDSLETKRNPINSVNDKGFYHIQNGLNARWASIELLLLFLKGKDIPETYIQSIQLIINRGRKTYGAIKQPSPEWSEQMVDDLCQQAIIEIDQAIYEVLIIVRKLEREVNLSELDLDEPLQLINGFYDTGDMLLEIDENSQGDEL